jgi:Flp pilus assembly protein TadD
VSEQRIGEAVAARLGTAERAWRRQSYGEVIPLLRDILPNISPRYSFFWYMLADAQMQTGAIDEARASLRVTFESWDEHEDNRRIGLPWKELATQAIRAGLYEEAARAFRFAIEGRPLDATLWNALGVAERKLRHHDEGRRCYERAIQLAPGVAIYHENLGNFHRDYGDLTSAIGSYERATQLAPARVDYWNELGIAQSRIGDTDSAVASLTRALELVPNDAITLFNLALGYVQMRCPEDVRKIFHRLLLVDPGMASEWIDRVAELSGGSADELWDAMYVANLEPALPV